MTRLKTLVYRPALVTVVTIFAATGGAFRGG